MRKFLINCLIFSVFAGIFYALGIFPYAHYAPANLKPNINYRVASYGHMYSRLAEVKNYGEVDILFLGSSHAYRGFDSRIFLEHGYKTFNLGSSSQTPIQTKILLKRYLDILNPKLVIYEVYPETFSIDGVESSLDLIANDHNDMYSLQMAFKLNNIKTYNTLLYGFERELLNRNQNITEPIQKGKDTYISGGYVEKKLDFYKPYKLDQKQINVRDYHIKAFEEITTELKNKKINLMLVYAPITKAKYQSYTNGLEFDSIMSSYSMYYNFNHLMDLDDTLHFYDPDHLNQNGVSLFNRKLIEYLKPKLDSLSQSH